MKKALLITFHFPPDIHPGAKRLGKFATYLLLYGWLPFVLTKETSRYHGIDETLCRALPSELTIHRVSEWHLDGDRREGTESGRSEASIFREMLLARICHGICRLFPTLDYPWLFPALWQGLRLLKRQRIDVILTSYPTQDALLVGLLLKSLTGRMWVADFRDLGVSLPWTRFLRAGSSSLRLAVDQLVERSVMHMADAIVVVGERMRRDLIDYYGRRIADKVHVVYNGYDHNTLHVMEVDSKEYHRCFADKGFSIIHVGSWHLHRTPECFLQALSQLLKERKDLRDKIRVEFIGEVRYDLDLAKRIPDLVQKLGLTKVVHREPHLPHNVAVSRLMASDIGLLVQPEVPDIPGATDHMVSSKIFEYMHAQKPILALVPVQGEAAEIVRTCHAGIAVSARDVVAIKKAILQMYEACRKGELTNSVNLDEIKKFDRREQTRRLAIILDSLTSGSV